MLASQQSQTDTGSYCDPVYWHASHTTCPPSPHQGSIQGVNTWTKMAIKLRKNDMQNTLNACTTGIRKCDLKLILRRMRSI
jgi:hypothetical protein